MDGHSELVVESVMNLMSEQFRQANPEKMKSTVCSKHNKSGNPYYLFLVGLYYPLQTQLLSLDLLLDLVLLLDAQVWWWRLSTHS